MSVYLAEPDVTLHHGDAGAVLAELPAGSVQCVVTSPPYYGLRDYGVEGQLGLEASPAAYVDRLVGVLEQVRRVLADDGVLWLNLGDSYAGKANGGQSFDRHRGQGHRSKQGIVPQRINNTGVAPYKSLLGIPWRVAFALIDAGWILRNEVIWNKPNAMPESVTDRLSTRHETVFLLSKSPRYWFDLDPIREALLRPEAADGTLVFGGVNKGGHGGVDSTARRRGGNVYGKAAAPALAPTGKRHTAGDAQRGRNPGDVWTISTQPFPGAHFATMPRELVRRCVLAGCPEGGTVLDPFVGSGTVPMVARLLGRRSVGVDLNAEYLAMAVERIGDPTLLFDGEEVSA